MAPKLSKLQMPSNFIDAQYFLHHDRRIASKEPDLTDHGRTYRATQKCAEISVFEILNILDASFYQKELIASGRKYQEGMKIQRYFDFARAKYGY